MFSSMKRTPALPPRAVRQVGSLACATLLLALFAPGAARASTILANGGFESPATAPQYESPSTADWTLTNAHVTSSAVLNSIGGSTTAADGVQFATLNASGSTGNVSQTFTTVALQQYEVTFAQNQFYTNGQATSVNLTAEVTAASGTLFSGVFTYNRGSVSGSFVTDADWAARSFTFTATDTSTTITFTGNTASPDDYGQAIDNVVINSVPEPGSFMLFAFGAIGSLAASRRLRRSGNPVV